PGFERVSIVKAPLGRANDRPRQSEQIFATGTPLERLADLAEYLLAADGKPVALLLLERGRVGLIAGDPHVQQLAAAHPICRRPALVVAMAIHAEGIDRVVVQRTAVGLAERCDRRPRNQSAKTGHLRPALGTR